MRTILFFVVFLFSLPAFAQQLEETNFGGDTAKVCTALRIATIAVDESAEFTAAKSQELAHNQDLLNLWAKMFAQLQIATNLAPGDVPADRIATAMQQVEEQANPAENGGEEEETWTAFDYSRLALSAASLADPTGVVGVAAAYTYPKCGSEDALKSSGGFCWKDSYGRGAGYLPRNFGRAADCPEGYTNNGLTCGRGAHIYSQPSRVADCPSGFRNMGASCFRGAKRYAQGSRVADCPKGFRNMGASCFRGAARYHQASRVADCPKDYSNTGTTCHRWWPPHTIGGFSSMKCKRGEFRTGGRCYKNCKAGYTNTGEFCERFPKSLSMSSMTCKAGEFRTGGRCYKNCRAGYTNTGEFCERFPKSLSMSSMTCKAGEFRTGGRCYKNCPTGYTNTGEFCHRDVSTLGASAMTCKANEFYKLGRCYNAATCGPGREFDNIGLCYPTCKAGFSGVGPVCWSGCTGKLGVACAAGCASSSAECGLATADMIASPLEMVGSIVTLGGYSSAKSARKASTIAAKQAAKAAIKSGAKRVAKSGVKKLDDLFDAAARATGKDALRGVGTKMAKQITNNAKTVALRTKKTKDYVQKNYATVRKRILDTVYQPVIDKASAAGRTGWKKTKNGWQKVKTKVTGKQPAKFDGWDLDPDELNPGVLDLAKALYGQMSKARSKVLKSKAVQTERLARSCAKAGYTISQRALQ